MLGAVAVFGVLAVVGFLLYRKRRRTHVVHSPISMEGISASEARDILNVMKLAPRWLMPNGDTEVAFVIEKYADGATQRLRLVLPAPVGGVPIVAARKETVRHRGENNDIFKVADVRVNGGFVEYVVEPLQHWQVPRPCEQRVLGWSTEYCQVASALAAGFGDTDASLFTKEIELRTASQLTLRADEIELDTENITFNDVKTLIVVPLATRSKRRCCGPSSLAYTRLLGEVDLAHSSDGRISSKRGMDDGLGLHSRRANIFFSWSFAQRFEDFVDAFDEYIVLPEVNIPVRSRQRMYGWISPLSLDQLAAKQDGAVEWAEKFEVLVRTIGKSREKGEEGKGHGTVVVFTPISAPLCSADALRDESFEPEPMARLWCVWEVFVTMKTGSRLTVIAPKSRYSLPEKIHLDARSAKCKGEEALLIRRVVEAQATMEVDARLDFADINEFVRDAIANGGRGTTRSAAVWWKRKRPNSLQRTPRTGAKGGSLAAPLLGDPSDGARVDLERGRELLSIQ